MAFEWSVLATMTAVVVAVVGLLATALFQHGAKIDRLADRMDGRFGRVDERLDRVDERFDRVEQRMREGKTEILERLDVLADRITRLETG